MGQKELRTNLIIGGKTTAGFNALGNKLEAMGAIVDKIGDKVREWEGESVEVYKDYETLMLEAEGALTTQYKSASQRARVMAELEEHVADWAANSIFHTDDMARAVNEAAHAGWTFEEMLEGIPVAMNLAQAGNISLSEGLDDLIKTLNATGMGTEYAETMVDQWTMAANSSATTVAELGEALKKMGATARFADSTEEIMAMLAVLADTGTVGEAAGTMLRNAMLRLVAPTTKADAAMRLLGMDAEEINDALSDQSVQKAAKKLKGLGFSAYDANGDLKSMMQIFGELNEALAGLDEAARNEIIAAIFPTRTTTAALAFLDATNGKFGELTEELKNSEGYASRIAKIQTSGLMGSTELLASKEEELKRKVGGILAEPLMNLQEAAGDFLDVLNAMPQETLTGLTGAATALGTMGPGLMIGGAVIKAIAALGPWGTAFVVAATGAAGLVSYLSALNEIKFEDHFGTIQLDLEQLGTYVEGTAGKLTAEQEAVEKWSGALAEAQKNYTDLTTALSEELIFDTLTGKQLTKAEKEQLKGYGKSIGESLLSGIGSARQADMDFLDVVFGNPKNGEETDTMVMAYDVFDSWYGDLTDRAGQLGEDLRLQIAAALKKDGIITEEERNQIVNKTLKSMDEIDAMIADYKDREAYNIDLERARHVSWDSAEAYMQMVSENLETQIAEIEDTYAIKRGKARTAIDYAYEHGTEFDWNGTKVKITDENLDDITERIMGGFDSKEAEALQVINDHFGDKMEAMFDSLMHDSDYDDAWRLLQRAKFNEDGSLDAGSLFAGMNEEELLKAYDQLMAFYKGKTQLFRKLPSGLFDTEQGQSIANLAEYADSAAREADRYSKMLWMNGVDTVQSTQEAWDREIEAASKRTELDYLQSELDRVDAEIAERERRIEEKGDWKDWWYNFTNGVAHDYAALHGGEWNPGGLYARRESLAQQVEEAREAVSSDEGVEVPVTATGGTEAMSAELDAMRTEASSGVIVPIFTRQGGAGTWKPMKYAEGGRATEASIFGEGDTAEWAIPEKHTPRTAELLNAARKAAGFDWDELMARDGKVSGGVTVNTTYAPTINAADSSGVADVLEKDKRRTAQIVKEAVREALREQRFRDSVEVYA